MAKIILNDEDTRMANELANLIEKVDIDPRSVSYSEKEKYYESITRNLAILNKAVEINKTRYIQYNLK